MANGLTRTNDLEFTGLRDTEAEDAFGAFVKNMSVHTFHHRLIVMRQDKYQPMSEYIVPAFCGFDTWSQIADVANASVVTNDAGDPAYNGKLRKLNENTKVGQRRPLLYITNKTARQLHTRHIVQSQTELPARTIKWVKDERFPKENRKVPLVASRGARPVICPTKDFRTTDYAAMSVTWEKSIIQMTPAVVDHDRIAPNEVDMFLIPPNGFAFAKGSGAPSMGSFLGLNGSGRFKHSMRMEKRDLLVAAAMKSGCIKYAKKAIADFVPEQPLRMEDQYTIQNQRWVHQQQLADYWSKMIYANITPMVAFNTLSEYRYKFPYNWYDYNKTFRKLLQAAVEDYAEKNEDEGKITD